MKVDKICILLNCKKIKSDNINDKLSIKDNYYIDGLLKKIIKYNFKKIYLLCPYKKNFLFNKYHQKKIHNSKIHCIEVGEKSSLHNILTKLKTKISNHFIFLDGKKFIDINYFDLIKSKVRSKLAEICLIKNNKSSFKKNINSFSYKNIHSDIGLYLFNKNIFNFIKNNSFLKSNNFMQTLIDRNKTLLKFYKGTVVDNVLLKKSNCLKNKALFLDRDGVINKHDGYILKYKKFIFLPGVKRAIKYANSKGYLVIIVTNQSAIGRSWLKESYLNKMHILMKKDMFSYNKSYVDDIFYSPYYHKSKKKIYRLNKDDRKPNHGMFLKAIKKWNVDITQSFFIGDQLTDKLAAKRSKIKFYYKINHSLLKQIKSII